MTLGKSRAGFSSSAAGLLKFRLLSAIPHLLSQNLGVWGSGVCVVKWCPGECLPTWVESSDLDSDPVRSRMDLGRIRGFPATPAGSRCSWCSASPPLHRCGGSRGALATCPRARVRSGLGQDSGPLTAAARLPGCVGPGALSCDPHMLPSLQALSPGDAAALSASGRGRTGRAPRQVLTDRSPQAFLGSASQTP